MICAECEVMIIFFFPNEQQVSQHFLNSHFLTSLQCQMTHLYMSGFISVLSLFTYILYLYTLYLWYL